MGMIDKIKQDISKEIAVQLQAHQKKQLKELKNYTAERLDDFINKLEEMVDYKVNEVVETKLAMHGWKHE